MSDLPPKPDIDQHGGDFDGRETLEQKGIARSRIEDQRTLFGAPRQSNLPGVLAITGSQV